MGTVAWHPYSAGVDTSEAGQANARFLVAAAGRTSGSRHDTAAGATAGPEIADVARLARRLLRRAVLAARAEDAPVERLLRGHLGPGGAGFPVIGGSWPGYDHVNVQSGLDAWLATGGRQHELVGLTGFRHMSFGLADLMQSNGEAYGLGAGSVALAARAAGPDDQTLACVQCGLYLLTDAGTPVALLLRGPDERGASEGVNVEVCAADEAVAQRVLDDIRRFAVDRNVFRGHVITFGGGEVFSRGGNALLRFLPRPRLNRSEVILPSAVLDGIERQVLGIARHAERLQASGQHLKRGVLLYGAPGTGKTHTVRYLLGKLPHTTVVVVSGSALAWIGEACSVARTLQPSVVVIEDVDLIAEERGARRGQNPLLFELLNEMDGLSSDVNVTFLLTTNRADMLEQALASRPGRVDHAAELPVPDGDARRRLIELYRGSLVLNLVDPDVVVRRTEGVTASFLKELLRRAAIEAAERTAGYPAGVASNGVASNRAAGNGSVGGGTNAGPLCVIDADMTAALDQLLDTRSQVTRVLLGGRVPRPTNAPPRDSTDPDRSR